MKHVLYTILILLTFLSPLKGEAGLVHENLFINGKVATALQESDSQEMNWLTSTFSADASTSYENYTFYHTFSYYDEDESLLLLDDQSTWNIAWWYSSVPKSWNQGDRLQISFHPEHDDCMQITNIENGKVAWGTLKYFPSKFVRIKEVSKENSSTFSTSNGLTFKALNNYSVPSDWLVKDRLLIFHQDNNRYKLYNIDKKNIMDNWVLTGNTASNKEDEPAEDENANILSLEDNLNKRVIGQPEATKAVADSIINAKSGLQNEEAPIASFLFLGPSGTGKTELAKVLTDEMYHDPSRMIRLDMSHFSEHYSITRLIGSPPGYVNHDEGGQLTEPLRNEPQSIVLLDEIEKAHSVVRKAFLPVFDEGYINDADNERVDCKDSVFIMTSNLFAKEIMEYFHQGYSDYEILRMIEPKLMERLSPELYNRIQPVIFRPLTPEQMNTLVALMLDKVSNRLKEKKQISINFDDTVIYYLVENGYHPELGARPMKQLIEKTILPKISHALISEKIPNSSTIYISYSSFDDSWHIEWEAPQSADESIN